MTERLEQRYCIKFCLKLGDSQVETIRKFHTVFGDDAMGITQIKEWYNRFVGGRTSVESEPRSDRPSKCRNDQVINKVNAVVMRDRRLTIREITKKGGLKHFFGTFHCDRSFGHEDSVVEIRAEAADGEAKQLRVEVSQDMLDYTKGDPDFLNTIITGDESWVYGYETETKS